MKTIKSKLEGLRPDQTDPTMLAQHYATNLKRLVQPLIFQMFFDNPIRFIPVETWCIKVFAKEATQSTI